MNTDTENTIAVTVLVLLGVGWVPVLISWLYYRRRDGRSSVEQVD